MRILVTGAAGFIGSHLAERLASSGNSVCGIDAFMDYYSLALKEHNAGDIEKKGVELLRLDLASDDLATPLEGVEVIFHLAAQPGISDKTPFESYERNNIVATYRLLEAARKVPALKCFINISTSSVYGYHATDNEDTPPKPTSYYGVTKLAAEQMALAYSREKILPATSVRLFSVYGERERPEKLFPLLMHHLLSDTEFPLFEGSELHSRSFTYVRDIINGLMLVLDQVDTCIDEVFNMGSDIETTTGEAIRITEEIMGRELKTRTLPRRSGDQLRTHADIGKARRLLGYNPTTPPQEGIANYAAWYQDTIFNKIDIFSS